jgi:peptidyl-prolyl cis-trans isomerase B (cyclophilin B)
MTDLEELFRSAASFAEDGHPLVGDPVGRVARARVNRRRRRTAALAIPVAALTVAGIAVVPVALSRGGHGGGDGKTSVATGGRTPTSFAAIGAGHAGVYDARTGARQRDLGPAMAVAAADDGYWVSSGIGCASTLRFVAPQAGSVSSQRQIAGQVSDLAVSPDGKTLAYTVAKTVDNQGVGPTCDDADLVLLDVVSGHERRWTGEPGSGVIGQLAWSADGRHLAFESTVCCDATATLHDLAVASDPGPVARVPAPLGDSQTCRFGLPAFVVDQLVAVRTCDGGPELVSVAADGRVRPLRTLPKEQPVALAAFGQTLLVALYGSAEVNGDLVRVEPDGSTTTLGTGWSQLSWVPDAATQPRPVDGLCDYRPDLNGAVGRQVGRPPSEPRTLPSRATIQTDRGDITVELTGSATPCTVNSFVHLAGHSYYDQTACHRVTTQGIFVLQCGDPSGKGSGGPGYRYDDENLKGTTYPAGTLAMANMGPGTNGSQFFLVYRDTRLDPSYTVFGHIVSGLAVVREVAAAGAQPAGDGKPKLPVTITGVTFS